MLNDRDTAKVSTRMRLNNLIWNYRFSNSRLGNRPPALDTLYTHLSGTLHGDLLDLLMHSLAA